jgi:hypothetical protein
LPKTSRNTAVPHASRWHGDEREVGSNAPPSDISPETTRGETDAKRNSPCLAQPPVVEGSFSLLRCLPEGEGASSTWEPMGAGWIWLIPMQPLTKRLERTTNGSNLVTVIKSKEPSLEFISRRVIGRIVGALKGEKNSKSGTYRHPRALASELDAFVERLVAERARRPRPGNTSADPAKLTPPPRRSRTPLTLSERIKIWCLS